MLPFVKDGPEIPQEIFHALEDDRLLFFCGAGISRYSDLPDFKELVEKLLPLLTDLDKRKVADGAFKRGQYDRALDVIEKNTLPNVMRRELIKELSNTTLLLTYPHKKTGYSNPCFNSAPECDIRHPGWFRSSHRRGRVFPATD